MTKTHPCWTTVQCGDMYYSAVWSQQVYVFTVNNILKNAHPAGVFTVNNILKNAHPATRDLTTSKIQQFPADDRHPICHMQTYVVSRRQAV
jgi:hypothetical protein